MVRLEIAALYAGINILLLLVLAFRVPMARRRAKISLGDGGNAELQRLMRAHGNAAEYIPAGVAGLTLLALLEPAAPLWLLHASGATLTLGRIAHGFGMWVSELNPGRVFGILVTLLSYALIGGGLIYAALARAL
jgi:uncharacterized membrane protein YecN with MAPEG domain